MHVTHCYYQVYELMLLFLFSSYPSRRCFFVLFLFAAEKGREKEQPMQLAHRYTHLMALWWGIYKHAFKENSDKKSLNWIQYNQLFQEFISIAY